MQVLSGTTPPGGVVALHVTCGECPRIGRVTSSLAFRLLICRIEVHFHNRSLQERTSLRFLDDTRNVVIPGQVALAKPSLLQRSLTLRVVLLVIDSPAHEPRTRRKSRSVSVLRRAKRAQLHSSPATATPMNGLAMFDDRLRPRRAARFANNAYGLVIEGESYRPLLERTIEPADPHRTHRSKSNRPGRRRV